MYKNRITKWGFDKKNKADEMKAIVKKKIVRAAIGKKSQFKLRGRPVDLEDVERYIKRKLLSPAEIVMQASSTSGSSTSTPNGLECLTPPNVPTSPQPPEILEVPEHIFTIIRDYFLGSFGAGTWVANNEISDCISTKRKGNEMVALKNLFSHHDVACQLLDNKSFQEAGRVLNSAFAGIKDILTAEHPRTVGALFDLCMYLRNRRRSDIAMILLRQLAGMASVLLPSSHPLGQIWKLIGSLDPVYFEQTLITAWQSALDRLEAVLGPLHYSTLRSRLEYIQMVESLYGLSRSETLLKDLVQKCKVTCGLTDVRTLKLLDTLGEVLMGQEKYTEAEQTADELVEHAPRILPRAKSIDLHVAGLFIIARVQKLDGRQELAQENLRKAIELNVSEWGLQHALTMKYLLYLEEWLSSWGRGDEAARVRETRSRILDFSEEAH